MRIILSDFMSIDGVAQAPGGPDEDQDGGFAHGGWSMPLFDPDTMGAVIDEVMQRSDALLFGRRTWDVMAAEWPTHQNDPFADQMNSIKKYVASRTLSAQDAAARWNNTTVLGGDGDAIEAIRTLRKSGGDGGLQVWGSTTLAQQLIEHDLVDEYVLMIEPILLGGGKTIFPPDRKARALELVSVKAAKTGVVICNYRPSGRADKRAKRA